MEQEATHQFKQAVIQGGSSTPASLALVPAILRAYIAIDRVESCYELYREGVVRPKLSAIITMQALEQGNRGSCDGLPNIFQSVLRVLTTDWLPFINCAQSSVKGFNFLANSVWVEIEDMMHTRIGKIYAPGIPESFHKVFVLLYVWCLS